MRRLGKIRHSGFTLLEMMVSLAIFALIGVASYRMLQVTADASANGVTRSAESASLRRTLQLVSSDVRQLYRGSLLLIPKELRFLRSGNAYDLPQRRDLIWVTLSLRSEDKGFVLLRALNNNSSNKDAALLKQEESVQVLHSFKQLNFAVIDESGNRHLTWPPNKNANASDARLQAAAVELSWQDQGAQRRVISLR